MKHGKWAIQDPDLEVYFANEQHDLTRTVTVCTKEGSSDFSPRTFNSEDSAEKFLKHILDHVKGAKGTRWKVVPFTS
jgi:hypothetical protein